MIKHVFAAPDSSLCHVDSLNHLLRNPDALVSHVGTHPERANVEGLDLAHHALALSSPAAQFTPTSALAFARAITKAGPMPSLRWSGAPFGRAAAWG
jgi:hypothetical protein